MIFINTYSHNVRKYRLKKPYYHHYLCCYSTLHEEKPQIPFYANPSVWLMDDVSMIELVFHLVGCWLGGEGVRWDEPRIMWKLYSIYMPSDTDPFLWNLIWNNQLNTTIAYTWHTPLGQFMSINIVLLLFPFHLFMYTKNSQFTYYVEFSV